MRRGERGRIGGGVAAGLLAAMLILAASSQAAAGEKWGPFRGRLVDVETGQGIAGGVVLAVWERAYPGVAGTVSEFHEAREAVSGADGLFEMPRLDPPFFSLNVRPPAFQFFAPGYGMVRWVVTPENGDPLVDPTVIEMRPMKTREERLRSLQSLPSVFFIAEPPRGDIRKVAPRDKFQSYLETINRERKSLNLNLLTY